MINLTNTKLAIKQSLTWAHLNGGLKNAVLLTFDDGPHPESTPIVLDLLQEYKARAIFFVVGARIHRAPHLLERILAEGHALGNHSYSHPLERQHRFGVYLQDLKECQKTIEQVTGHTPKYFRPPLGTFSLTSLIAPRLLGLTTVLWSANGNDWELKNAAEARTAAERLVKELTAKPSANDIVLLHDDHRYAGEMLEVLLPQLVARNCDLSSALDSIK
ncbi:MAG TPA: polysaccharide deacetylase family protein [Pyrinomonadaceae bacterium]|nr:polysaccharide deacetylase family protein [Pyrinomonadaceae bacterium]